MAASDWVSAPDSSERTWADTGRDALQTVDDTVRAAANAMTFGMADRFAGYMNSGGPQTMKGLITGEKPLSYDESVNKEVERSQKARERSPYASVVGDVAGSVALPGFGAEGLAARYGSGALARAGAYGVTGAGVGAAQGAGNTYTGDISDYLKNAAIGGTVGGVLGAGAGAAFGPRPQTSSAVSPTAAEHFSDANSGYRALGNSAARYEPQALADTAEATERTMTGAPHYFRPDRSERAFTALDEMRGAPSPAFPAGPGPVAPGQIEAIRQGMSGLNPLTAGQDMPASRVVRRALDDFVVNPPPGSVLPGTEAAAANASATANRARGSYAAGSRVEALDDIIHNAQSTTGATHSGLNLMNELRKGARTFTKQKEGVSPASIAGYNDAEIEALTNYARGRTGSNTLRWASNALGGGQGLGFLVGSGVAGGAAGQYFKDDPQIGAVAGVAAPTAGLILKAIGNRRANAEIAGLRDMISQRSPLYAQRAATAPMVSGGGSNVAAKTSRDAITLELMKQLAPAKTSITVNALPGSAREWE